MTHNNLNSVLDGTAKPCSFASHPSVPRLLLECLLPGTLCPIQGLAIPGVHLPADPSTTVQAQLELCDSLTRKSQDQEPFRPLQSILDVATLRSVLPSPVTSADLFELADKAQEGIDLTDGEELVLVSGALTRVRTALRGHHALEPCPTLERALLERQEALSQCVRTSYDGFVEIVGFDLDFDEIISKFPSYEFCSSCTIEWVVTLGHAPMQRIPFVQPTTHTNQDQASHGWRNNNNSNDTQQKNMSLGLRFSVPQVFGIPAGSSDLTGVDLAAPVAFKVKLLFRRNGIFHRTHLLGKAKGLVELIRCNDHMTDTDIGATSSQIMLRPIGEFISDDPAKATNKVESSTSMFVVRARLDPPLGPGINKESQTVMTLATDSQRYVPKPRFSGDMITLLKSRGDFNIYLNRRAADQPPQLLYAFLLKLLLSNANPNVTFPELDQIKDHTTSVLRLSLRSNVTTSSITRSATAANNNCEYIPAGSFAIVPMDASSEWLLEDFQLYHALPVVWCLAVRVSILANQVSKALRVAASDDDDDGHGARPESDLSQCLSYLAVVVERLSAQLEYVRGDCDMAALMLLDTFCPAIYEVLEHAIVSDRHILCADIHFGDGTFSALLRAHEIMYQLNVTALSVAAAQRSDPTSMPSLLLCMSTKNTNSGVQAHLTQQLVNHIVPGYRQLKTRAIRDVGFSEVEADIAFHCERFTVTLPMPMQPHTTKPSSALHHSGGSKDPMELATYALKSGATGTSVWGVRLKQVHLSGLVEIADIMPGSSCAVEIASEAVHGVVGGAGQYSNGIPYQRQPKHGDLLIAVNGESVVGWNVQRVQAFVDKLIKESLSQPKRLAMSGASEIEAPSPTTETKEPSSLKPEDSFDDMSTDHGDEEDDEGEREKEVDECIILSEPEHLIAFTLQGPLGNALGPILEVEEGRGGRGGVKALGGDPSESNGVNGGGGGERRRRSIGEQAALALADGTVRVTVDVVREEQMVNEEPAKDGPLDARVLHNSVYLLGFDVLIGADASWSTDKWFKRVVEFTQTDANSNNNRAKRRSSFRRLNKSNNSSVSGFAQLDLGVRSEPILVLNALRDRVRLRLYHSHRSRLFSSRQTIELADLSFELRNMLPKDLSSFKTTRWFAPPSSSNLRVKLTIEYDALRTASMHRSVGGAFGQVPTNIPPLSGPLRSRSTGNGWAPAKSSSLSSSSSGRAAGKSKLSKSSSIRSRLTPNQAMALTELVKDHSSRDVALFLPAFAQEYGTSAVPISSPASPVARSRSIVGMQSDMSIGSFLSRHLRGDMYNLLIADIAEVLRLNPPRRDHLSNVMFPLHQSLRDMLDDFGGVSGGMVSNSGHQQQQRFQVFSVDRDAQVHEALANMFRPYVYSWVEVTWKRVRDTHIPHVLAQAAGAINMPSASLVGKKGKRPVYEPERGGALSVLDMMVTESMRVFFALRLAQQQRQMLHFAKRFLGDAMLSFLKGNEARLVQCVDKRAREFLAVTQRKIRASRSPNSEVSQPHEEDEDEANTITNDLPPVLDAEVLQRLHDTISVEHVVTNMFRSLKHEYESRTMLQAGIELTSIHRVSVCLYGIEGVGVPVTVEAMLARSVEQLIAGGDDDDVYHLSTMPLQGSQTISETLAFDTTCTTPVVQVNVVRVPGLSSLGEKREREVLGFLEIPISPNAFPVGDSMHTESVPMWWGLRPADEMQPVVKARIEGDKKATAVDGGGVGVDNITIPIAATGHKKPRDPHHKRGVFSRWFGSGSDKDGFQGDDGLTASSGRSQKAQLILQRRSTNTSDPSSNAHPRLRLEIKHELVDLEMFVQDQVYDSVTRILDSLSASLCCAVDALVQSACGIAVASNQEDSTLPSSAKSRRRSSANGTSSAGQLNASNTLNESTCRAALLQVVDSELTTVYEWLSSSRGLGAAGPMHFKRFLLRVHRRVAARLLQLLLPNVRADNLVGLEGVIDEACLTFAALSGDSNFNSNTTSLSESSSLKSSSTRRHTVIYEAQSARVAAIGSSTASSVSKEIQSASSSSWWQSSSRAGRNSSSGDRGDQQTSQSTILGGSSGGLAQLELCQRLWNQLLVYFDAEGNGLSKSLLLLDPQGPHQVQLVFASLRAGHTVAAKRAMAVAASLLLMNERQQEMLAAGKIVISDEKILQHRAAVRQLFREWVCCKCVEYSLVKSRDGSCEEDSEVIAALMPSQATLNAFASLLQVPDGQVVNGWMLAVLGN